MRGILPRAARSGNQKTGGIVHQSGFAEVVHELGANVDLNADFVFDLDGNLVFMDRDKSMIVGNGDAEA